MIEIVNLTKQKVRNDLIVKIIEKTLAGEKAKKWDISVCFVGSLKIKELNKNFRGIDASTDVLSFAGLEIKGSKKKLGEIFVCLKEIENNAQKEKQSFQKMLNWALVHSTLHLLGFDHESTKKQADKMFEKEKKYLKN